MITSNINFLIGLLLLFATTQHVCAETALAGTLTGTEVNCTRVLTNFCLGTCLAKLDVFMNETTHSIKMSSKSETGCLCPTLFGSFNNSIAYGKVLDAIDPPKNQAKIGSWFLNVSPNNITCSVTSSTGEVCVAKYTFEDSGTSTARGASQGNGIDTNAPTPAPTASKMPPPQPTAGDLQRRLSYDYWVCDYQTGTKCGSNRVSADYAQGYDVCESATLFSSAKFYYYCNYRPQNQWASWTTYSCQPACNPTSGYQYLTRTCSVTAYDNKPCYTSSSTPGYYTFSSQSCSYPTNSLTTSYSYYYYTYTSTATSYSYYYYTYTSTTTSTTTATKTSTMTSTTTATVTLRVTETGVCSMTPIPSPTTSRTTSPQSGITVVYPTTNTIWKAGSKYTFTWKPASTGTVNIFLVMYGFPFVSTKTTVKINAPNTGKYGPWLVPSNLYSTTYQFYVIIEYQGNQFTGQTFRIIR